MARTAPIPNMAAIPGMNPGIFVLGGGGGNGGSGAGGGKGKGGKKGAKGKNGGKDANGGGKNAGNCGPGAKGAGSCPNQHAGGGVGGKLSKGDPVDVVTGRVFTLPELDLSLPGPLPLQVERAYSSTARERDVGFGFGWSSSLCWHVLEGRRSLVVQAYDGTEHDFEKITAGEGKMGPHGWVLHRENQGYRLDIEGDQCLCFDEVSDSDGRRLFRLTAIQDRSNNCITLGYDDGILARITDSVGREIRVTRARDGRIGALQARNALEQGQWVTFTRYEYDADGRLVLVEDGDGFCTTYRYDENHLLTSQTDATGLCFSFVYDEQARCIETWGEYPGRVDISLADDVPLLLADGRTKAKGILHTVLEYAEDGYSEAVDSVSVNRYFGNDKGLVDKAVTPQGVFTRSYDERGNLTSFTDALGAVTRWKQDPFGRELETTDALGHTTRIERDGKGEIVEIVGHDGEITRVSRANGILSYTDPLGATVSVHYDGRGLPVKSVWPDGRMLVFERDAHGNVTLNVDEHGARTRTRFDFWGRPVEAVDPRGGTVHLVYSTMGRLLRSRAADGTTRSYTYDGAGNQTSITDASGFTTRLLYGGYHKLSRAELPNGEIIEFRYNREGWLTHAKNGRGEVHRFLRDMSGLLVEEHTFDGRTLRYGYDAMGRMSWSENGSDERTEYERDLCGRLAKTIYPDGTEEVLERNAYGDIIAAENPSGRYVFQRNAMGWIVAEEQEVSGEKVRVDTSYRITGEVERCTTSLGHSAEWARDFAERRTALSLNGRPEEIASYDPFGLEVRRELATGTVIQTSYDALLRMAERQIVKGGGAVTPPDKTPAWVGQVAPGALFSQVFQYTPEGDLAEVSSSRRGKRTYAYDPIGQLTDVRADQRELESYAYDLSGNRHDRRQGAALRTYGPGGLLEKSGGTTFVWDHAGRLVEKRVPSRDQKENEEVTRYRWSGVGMLSAVERPDGMVVEFEYDPFARRVQKRVLQSEPSGRKTLVEATRYVWDGAALVHEIKRRAAEDGNPVVVERTYVFEQGRTAPRAHRDVRTENGERVESPWWHYLNDDSGAPEMLVGADGSVACDLARDTWGMATPEPGAVTDTPFRFRGQYADIETGLSYNRHRYYDPELGRYISADPIGIDGGLNAFAYAKNSPTSAVDPEGLVYTIIRDKEGKIVAEGENCKPMPTKGPIPATTVGDDPPTHKPCAERDALNNLAKKMGPGTKKEDIAKKFNEDGHTLETWEGSKEDYDAGVRIPANPCRVCKVMLKDDMGIKKGVKAHNSPSKKKKGKMVDWDGESIYIPTGKGEFEAAKKKR